MLTIDVITLFPEMFAPAIGLSIIGRTIERGLVSVRLHQLLEFCESERADDAPYGGGAGMVLRLEPLARSLDAILASSPPDERRAMLLTSPSGRRFAQDDAVRFAGLDRLIVVCGHYEGVDERLPSIYPLEEISLGDFILTGGEIPALAIVDATVRLIEGAIRPESLESESFARPDQLDYPAYTRPPRFRGVDVPEVLLSGDHAKIAAWRREQSRQRAARRRGDSV
jgi:tRNA (guanine37-N1)-methyltransferase